MIILVDDERYLEFADIIFRNGDYFADYYHLVKEYLFGPMDAHTIIFDHDLGIGQTGEDCLNMLRDTVVYATVTHYPTIGLISSNPAGRAKMRDTLIYDMGYDFLRKIYYGVYDIDYYIHEVK